MAFGRYTNDPRLNLGDQLGTSKAAARIRREIKIGRMPITNTIILTGDDRLDTLAGSIYGDSSYWWVLAAASNIGWGLQVPPGTQINIVSLSDVQKVVS